MNPVNGGGPPVVAAIQIVKLADGRVSVSSQIADKVEFYGLLKVAEKVQELAWAQGEPKIQGAPPAMAAANLRRSP